MHNWYIDRSKNFINPSLNPVLKYLHSYDGERDSTTLIDNLIMNDIFDSEAGNPNAAMTRFRDHGLIDNNNNLGDPAVDYVEGRLSRDELIVDLLFKRPADKKNSPDIKPFVILCMVFDIMYELVADPGEVFLTYEECHHYLLRIESYSEITYEFVESILDNRDSGTLLPTLLQNDTTNMSIWMNALRNTPLILAKGDKNCIHPNHNAREFFGFISINGKTVSETPTSSNSLLYKYYCDRRYGFAEMLPDVLIPNIVVSNESDAIAIYNYLMGIKYEPDFDFTNFITNDSFGVYHSLILFPGLVIRNIWMHNKPLAKSIYQALHII